MDLDWVWEVGEDFADMRICLLRLVCLRSKCDEGRACEYTKEWMNTKRVMN